MSEVKGRQMQVGSETSSCIFTVLTVIVTGHYRLDRLQEGKNSKFKFKNIQVWGMGYL